MLGITPLVSMSERRLGLITNSSIPLDSAKEVLESSTSLRVRPICSRKSRNFLTADNTVLRPQNLFHYRGDPNYRQKCSKKILIIHAGRLYSVVAMHSEASSSLTPMMPTWVNKPFPLGNIDECALPEVPASYVKGF